MPRHIFAAEINYEDISHPLREKLCGTEANVKSLLGDLSCQVDEAFIVSNPERFSIYAVSESLAPLEAFFRIDPALAGRAQFYYNTEESISHLFATASGLLSPVKGEHEILAQLTQAHQWAIECDSIGLTLDTLIRHALRLGKKIRTATGIDTFCSSVVDAGIELLYDRVDSLHKKSFLIIGTGKIAKLAARYLYNEGIQNIVIAGADRFQAQALANAFYAEAVGLEDVCDHFMKADVIIAGTHHEIALSEKSLEKASLSFSGYPEATKMRFILDFGMPGNIDRKLGRHHAIQLYGLDDLKRLHKTPLDAFGGLEDAWSMVTRHAREFMMVIHQLELSPVLAAYWNRMLDLHEDQTHTLLPKLKDVSTRDVELIRKRAHKLIRGISRDPFRNMNLLVNNQQLTDGHALVQSFISWGDLISGDSLN